MVVLAVFAAVGVAVLDDYGVSVDEDEQRRMGQTAVDYVLGDGHLLTGSDRYYGVSFEAPLVLAERLLGLDSRAAHLLRHLATHLFFLTGGFFCWLLAHRLFGDRRLALFALLLYLLHPRLYAHSFFNSKDIPFLATFMIALWLVERAFRRDTAAAFALCGAGVGVLIDLRVMGVALFAAVPGLRALDLLLQARDAAGRRRALVTAAVFVLAAAGTRYAVAPWLWSDPLAVVDAFETQAWHPNRRPQLFQGELVRWPSIPPHYLPTWMAITTPPATLLLALAGAAAVVRRGAARPRDVLRNTGLRFEWLLLACLTLPPAAVVALNSNVYNGWRQMYFLYAPLCLLAACGLRGLLAAARRPWARRAAGVLAAAALAGMAVDVTRLHPYQAAYFNFLVDRSTRSTPERLGTRYDVLYWGTEYREGLEYLLARHPDETLYVDVNDHVQLRSSRAIFPAAARDRIVLAREAGRAADFFISPDRETVRPHLIADNPAPRAPRGVLHTRRIYGNTVLMVRAVDLSRVDEAAAEHYRAAYRAAAAGEPLFRSPAFDLHLDGRTLTWVIEACRPEDTRWTFLLEVVPVNPDDLPVDRRERGWRRMDFKFGQFGVRFDGRCLARRTLPDFPVRALRVGRWFREAGGWRREAATIDVSPGSATTSSSTAR